MFRLLLFWRPHLTRRWWVVLVIGVAPTALSLVLGVPLFWAAAGSMACCAALSRRYLSDLLRFCRNTWRFRTVAGEHVVLRYAPELDGNIDVEHLLGRGEKILAEFSGKFGFPLRRRLVLFLFANGTSIGKTFNAGFGGCAFTHGDAIVLCADRQVGGSLDEVLLHELAHLFSARLGELDPPLKGEGLATWLMSSVDGKPIDFHALVSLLTDRYLFLTWLTNTAWFYTSSNSYYVAGSFTGHLIRRFGWERYREFFNRAGTKDFEATFGHVYGMSLLAAEHQWREELLERRQTFEPELTRWIGERSVEAAYQAGHVYRCLQEADALSRAGQASGRVLWYAAATHLYLGHYQDAASLLAQAIQTEDPWIQAKRSSAWLQLGNCHDLLGQREKAMPAYQQVLSEPDNWYSPSATSHREARRYLSQPFTEQDLQAPLQPYAKAARRR